MFNTEEDIANYLYSLTKEMPIDEVLDFALRYTDSLQTIMKFDEVAVIEMLMNLDNRFLSGEAIKYEVVTTDNVNTNGTFYITRQRAKEIKEEGLHLRLTYFRKA